MKRIIVLLLVLFFAVSCFPSGCDTSIQDSENQTILKMELDKDYDDKEAFVNERLFCVLEDVEEVHARGVLDFAGEDLRLEIKNNKTKEILWSEAWEKHREAEIFPIILKDLSKDEEYVMTLTGKGIQSTVVSITFDNRNVQERERPM